MTWMLALTLCLATGPDEERCLTTLATGLPSAPHCIAVAEVTVAELRERLHRKGRIVTRTRSACTPSIRA